MPTTRTATVLWTDVHGAPHGDPMPCNCFREVETHNRVWRFGLWQCPMEARSYLCDYNPIDHARTPDDETIPAYRTPSGVWLCDECSTNPAALYCQVEGCEVGATDDDPLYYIRGANPDDSDATFCRQHRYTCSNCDTLGAMRISGVGVPFALCDDCRDNVSSECAVCGGPEAVNIYLDHRGDCSAVCSDPDCNTMCDYCGVRVPADELNSDNACQTCEDDSFECDHCGDRYYDSQRHYYNDEQFCASCVRFCDGCEDYHPLPRCPTTINRWDYRPQVFNFHPTTVPEPGRLYIGFELEAELANDYASPAEAAEYVLEDAGGADNPYLYLKDDGSLMAGFEMVSHPFDPEWALDESSPFPWHAIKTAAEMGMQGIEQANCGLHMHLSRDAFGESHLWKFLQFHYRNPRAMQAIALRSSTGYAKWDDNERRQVLKYVQKKAKNPDRYVAVNLQNDDTIELRYWKATLDVEAVKRAIRIAYGIYLYTKDLTCKGVLDGGLTFGAFRKWATKRWPDLFDFMKERTAGVEESIQVRPAWPPRQGPPDWSVGDWAFLDLSTRHGNNGVPRHQHGEHVQVTQVFHEFPVDDLYRITVETRRGNRWGVNGEMLTLDPPRPMYEGDELHHLFEPVPEFPDACPHCEECCEDCAESCDAGDCQADEF